MSTEMWVFIAILLLKQSDFHLPITVMQRETLSNGTG